MPVRSFNQDIFPNIQSKPPLPQLSTHVPPPCPASRPYSPPRTPSRAAPVGPGPVVVRGWEGHVVLLGGGRCSETVPLAPSHRTQHFQIICLLPSLPVEGFCGCRHYKSLNSFFFSRRDALSYADSSQCQLKCASGSGTSPVTFSNASGRGTAPTVRFQRVDGISSTTEHLLFPIKMCKIIKPKLMCRLEILVPKKRIVYNPSLLLTC